ncbi:SDR family NAD(P)-dependent oxidoreductase [Caulobacter mirabilis]|nr:SDR family NAD(P)-dependent oxidoreductase [Caulobacter mirabilis]
MTGATGGIGLAAAKRLLAEPKVSLIVGARAPDRLPADLAGRLEARSLDLASLASVEAFAATFADDPEIDVLILNAGIQNVSDATSADGFELSFAVNHLAHHLLIRALLPHLARNGRIVLTASGTHDPDEDTGLPPPRHIDAAKLAWPKQDPDLDPRRMTRGRRAYTASKLANVMTARELGQRRPDLTTVALDPGFTPGTGLARDYPGPAGLIFRFILPRLVRRTARVSTPENSGRLLAALATDERYAGLRGRYMAVRGEALIETRPSAVAHDDALAARLWEDSARLAPLRTAPPQVRHEPTPVAAGRG